MVMTNPETYQDNARKFSETTESNTHNELMSRAIRVRTAIRAWQHRIGEHIKTNEWPIGDLQDSILFLTVYEGFSDNEIKRYLDCSNECVIKVERASAISVLLTEFVPVLKQLGTDDPQDILSILLRSTEQKILDFRVYIDGRGQDNALGTILEGYMKGGHVGQLAKAYLDLRSDLYALTSDEFQSVKALRDLTGYSDYHLRDLIAQGLVEGTQTELGWYGSVRSASGYRNRKKGRTNT